MRTREKNTRALATTSVHATLSCVPSRVLCAVCRETRRTERENHVPISRISQYITCGPQEVGRPLLSALVATGASDPESEATAQPRGIVHTVLIGIHCRTSDLFRRLPGECRPMPRYLGVLAHYQLLHLAPTSPTPPTLLPPPPSYPTLDRGVKLPSFFGFCCCARGGSLIAKNACPRLIREARDMGLRRFRSSWTG